MNELAQQLHEAAITLENDAEFHRAYTASAARPCADARSIILSHGKRLGLSETVAIKSSREQLRRYFDNTYNLPNTRTETVGNCLEHIPTIEFWKDEVREGREIAKAYDPATTPKGPIMNKTDIIKEITMNKTAIIKITTKTLVNGTDVKELDDSTIYNLIADQEAEIKRLEAIENKPKKLVAEIGERRAGIKALVDYLDSKAD